MFGFLGGVFIVFGFLLDVCVIGNLLVEWGSLLNFLGGVVFFVGFMLVVFGGVEFIIGNMMFVFIVLYVRKILFCYLFYNWFWVMFVNFLGVVFIVYFFGYIVGLIEMGFFLDKMVVIV